MGLVFKDYGDKLFPNGIPKQFKDDLLKIEDVDNGIGNNFHVISNLVANMNPTWDSKQNPDQAFLDAVNFVQEHYVEQYIEKGYLPEQEQEILETKNEELHQVHAEATERARNIIHDAMANPSEEVAKGVVVLPQANLPWLNVVCEDPDAKFIVEPSSREGYCLQAVPPVPGSFDQRLPFPEVWVSNNPEGATYVADTHYFAAFDTQDHAIAAVNDIMQVYEQQKENVLDNIEAGSSPEDVPKEFQNDIDVVIAAVRNDPDEIQFAADFLKENAEVLEVVNE